MGREPKGTGLFRHLNDRNLLSGHQDATGPAGLLTCSVRDSLALCFRQLLTCSTRVWVKVAKHELRTTPKAPILTARSRESRAERAAGCTRTLMRRPPRWMRRPQSAKEEQMPPACNLQKSSTACSRRAIRSTHLRLRLRKAPRFLLQKALLQHKRLPKLTHPVSLGRRSAKDRQPFMSHPQVSICWPHSQSSAEIRRWLPNFSVASEHRPSEPEMGSPQGPMRTGDSMALMSEPLMWCGFKICAIQGRLFADSLGHVDTTSRRLRACALCSCIQYIADRYLTRLSPCKLPFPSNFSWSKIMLLLCSSGSAAP